MPRLFAFVEKGFEGGAAGALTGMRVPGRGFLQILRKRLSLVCPLFPVSPRLSVFGRYSVSSDNLAPGYFAKAV